MSPYAALLATVLVATSSTTGVNAQFDVRSLGHHAHAALTQLSHLPEIVGLVNPQGEIETSTVTQDKRSLWARYYGDSRGFSQPKPLVERRGTIPTGWTDVGCVTEGTSARTLDKLSYIDSNLTPEGCMTTCLSRGYTVAGTEWSNECYCGDGFENGGGAPSSSGCVNTCAGDADETCGGNYFLNAYQYTANSTTCGSDSVASSAVASATKASSALASASASGFSSVRASASAYASGSASGSATASSSAASATSSAGVTTEWEYMGCYWDKTSDNGGLHLLQGTALTGQTDLTPALCQTRCAAQGYNFAGLEYGQECYCGDVTASELAGFKDNAPYCNQVCTGDASQTCGGGWSLAIYEQVDVSDDC